MGDSGDEQEKKENVLKVEEAKSGRSTCKSTGDKIEKGEWRVGMDIYAGGRVSTGWQKMQAFLEGCKLEYCEGKKAGFGMDKRTGEKFKKGDVRFQITCGHQKKFLSLESAGLELKPVLEQATEWGPLKLQGVQDLREAERHQFHELFGVPEEEAQAFDKEHPAPEAPAEEEEQPKKRQKRVAVKVEDAEVAQESEEAEVLTVKPEPQDSGKAGLLTAKVEPKEPISDYELARQAQILRNQERMKALQLPSIAQQAMPDKPRREAKQRGISAKRKKAEAADVPRRASLRQRGVKSSGMAVDYDLNGRFRVQYENGVRPEGPHLEEPQPEAPKERHPGGLVDFKSENGKNSSDEAFLQLLTQSAPGRAKSKKAASPTFSALTRLQLEERDVAKMTRNGIVHLAFHPSSSVLVIAAADKSGHVGLWSVDECLSGRPSASASKENRAASPARGEGDDVKGVTTGVKKGADGQTELEEEDGDDDGVLELQPHFQYVSGLRWAGGSGAACKLFTASYDGSLRMLDPQAGRFELLITDEDAEYSAMDCMSDGNCGILGDNDGNLEVWDRREEGRQEVVNVHDKKINTIHVEPGEERYFITSCSDNSIALFDLRKMGKGSKPAATATHSLTCQSAVFAPDGSGRVLTCSRDNTLKVWDSKRYLDEMQSWDHYNNTGRWVVPFRAVWGPRSDAVICGSMKRSVDIINAAGKEQIQLSSEFQTAISSRHAVHPAHPILAAGTASGRMHIYR